MGIIAKVGGALQQVFGRIAEEAAEASGVIVRKRKFTGLSLARTFVLGYLRNPEATDEELAQIAVQSGADVTPQAIDQRHTVKLVKFLHELFCRATKVVVGSDQALAPNSGTLYRRHRAGQHHDYAAGQHAGRVCGMRRPLWKRGGGHEAADRMGPAAAP